MRSRVALAAILLAAAAPALAAPRECRGALTGSVKGKFDCTVAVVEKEGAFYLVIDGKDPIDGVPGYAPGSFEIPERVEARTYTLDTLGPGRATVAAEGGTLYTASKTSIQRGEVTLTLTSVKKGGKAKGAYIVHGTYRARLPPAGGGKSGEVTVEVEF